LIDWCLTPTLEVFQLYRGVEKKNKQTTKRTRPNKNEKKNRKKKETYLNLDRVSGVISVE